MKTDEYVGRIRSARRRKREAKEDWDKQLLKLRREWNLVRPRFQNVEWVPLAYPYQRGWERVFVLRDDVKRDSKADFYTKILEKINTRQWSSTKEFKQRKKVRGRKCYMPREQFLNDIPAWEFFSKKFADNERQCFEVIIKISDKRTYVEYRFIARWRFVLKVRPNMVTHTRLLNTERKSRYTYLEAFFDRDNNGARVHKLLHGSHQHKSDWRKGDPVKRDDPFHNKSFVAVLDEHWPIQTQATLKTLPTDREGSFFYRPSKFAYLLHCAERMRSCILPLMQKLTLRIYNAFTDINHTYTGNRPQFPVAQAS